MARISGVERLLDAVDMVGSILCLPVPHLRHWYDTGGQDKLMRCMVACDGSDRLRGFCDEYAVSLAAELMDMVSEGSIETAAESIVDFLEELTGQVLSRAERQLPLEGLDMPGPYSVEPLCDDCLPQAA